MEFVPEDVMDELANFARRPQTVSPVLENYLKQIATTGNIVFPWHKLKPLVKRKMELVLEEFSGASPPEDVPSFPNTKSFDFELLKNNMLVALDAFSGAPFTIQRLCELITNPRKHYNRIDKYMRGLEKNLYVVSTFDVTEAHVLKNTTGMVNGGFCTSERPYEGNVEEAAESSASGTVNGTVLETFASVFPSATTRIHASNNMHVPVMAEDSPFSESTDIESFSYSSDGATSDTPQKEDSSEGDASTSSICSDDINNDIKSPDNDIKSPEQDTEGSEKTDDSENEVATEEKSDDECNPDDIMTDQLIVIDEVFVDDISEPVSKKARTDDGEDVDNVPSVNIDCESEEACSERVEDCENQKAQDESVDNCVSQETQSESVEDCENQEVPSESEEAQSESMEVVDTEDNIASVIESNDEGSSTNNKTTEIPSEQTTDSTNVNLNDNDN